MIVTYLIETAKHSGTRPSGGIGCEDFRGLGNFYGLVDISGRRGSEAALRKMDASK
jgi:hypothetical protein